MAFQMNLSGTFQGDPWVHLTHLLNHCLRLSHFLSPLKERNVITFQKPCMDPKFPQNLRPVRNRQTIRKSHPEYSPKVQKHIEERSLLNASQFVFRARHNMTLQCMRLTDYVTLNFNNNMCTAAVFFDIEEAFDTTWQSGLLCKLSRSEFSTSLINSPFLHNANSVFR
jgi:hypothetical protein